MKNYKCHSVDREHSRPQSHSVKFVTKQQRNDGLWGTRMDWEENLGARPAVFMKTGFESEGAQFSPAQKPSFELWYNYSIFLRLLHVSASLEQKEEKRHLILSRDRWFKEVKETR